MAPGPDTPLNPMAARSVPGVRRSVSGGGRRGPPGRGAAGKSDIPVDPDRASVSSQPGTPGRACPLASPGSKTDDSSGGGAGVTVPLWAWAATIGGIVVLVGIDIWHARSPHEV